MTRPIKILSRVFLVVGLLFLSLRPSLTTRVCSGELHLASLSLSHSVSLNQKEARSQEKQSWRSSFHRNEDKQHLFLALAPSFDTRVLSFRNVTLVQTLPGRLNQKTFQSSSITVLLI